MNELFFNQKLDEYKSNGTKVKDKIKKMLFIAASRNAGSYFIETENIIM